MPILINILEKIFFISLTFYFKKFMETETENVPVAQIMSVEAVTAKQPLFLPRGSVRALVTLILLLVMSGSFVWHYELPTDFYLMSIFAIGYYVGYRTDNTQLPIIKE